MSQSSTFHHSVSILIPNYNGGPYLTRTLQSCLEQQIYVKEIIVVDDHSTDDSWKILNEWQNRFPETIKIFRNIGKGGNVGRNYAFSQSSGTFVQWLDSDDQILPNKFAKQLNVFATQSEVDIVYSDWQMDFWDGDQ
ncbi:MAG: glycosyltransferase family 2 protein, partial [Bacteroidia bacterium]